MKEKPCFRQTNFLRWSLIGCLILCLGVERTNAQDLRIGAFVGGIGIFARATLEDSSEVQENELDVPKDTKTSDSVPPLTGANGRFAVKGQKIEGVLAALNDRWPEVQAKALASLEESDALELIPHTTIPRIAALLKYPDDNVRLAAIKALAGIGSPAKDFLPQIAAFLTHHTTDLRIAAVTAIGMLGKGEERIYLSQLLTMMKDHDLSVRSAAVRALRKLDESGETYLPQLLGLLDHSDPRVRVDAVLLLGNLGKDSQPYVSRIMALLDDNDVAVREAALKVTRKLGDAAAQAVPRLMILIEEEDDSTIRIAAVKALSAMSTLPEDSLQTIVTLLQDTNPDVRAVAVLALSSLGGEALEPYLSSIAECLDDSEAQVRTAAVEVLGGLDERTEPYIQQLIAMLEDEDWEVRATVVEVLGNAGEVAVQAIPGITALFEDEDWFVRSRAVKAFGMLIAQDDSGNAQFDSLLHDEDGNVRAAAVWVLGNWGEKAGKYKSHLLELLEDPHQGVRYAAVRALENLGTASVEDLPVLVDYIHKDPSRTAELRFLAHSIGNGGEAVEIFLQWFGNPGENFPDSDILSSDDVKYTLQVFDAAWSSAVAFDHLRLGMETQIGDLVEQMSSQWEEYDLPLLRSHARHLASIASPRAKPIQRLVLALTIRSIVKSPFFIGTLLCLLHPLLWLLLLFLYPFSALVRKGFFWNPYVRKIAGLGYIHIALIRLPSLRRRLFQPFQRSLLTDAALENFDDAMYFKESKVCEEPSQQTYPLHEAIQGVQGKIILEGDSGLGKSMFARYVLKYSIRPAVYLPAEKCSNGVVEAIQPKLRGEAGDLGFLETLIHAGALDICIDGFDALSERKREHVLQFLQEIHGNVLITNRTMEWTPPGGFNIFAIQPLEQKQIGEFLNACYRILPEDVPLSRAEYTLACKDYLARILDEHSSVDVSAPTQQILSNPMNLTMIALLKAYKKEPQLLGLGAQCYQIMIGAYQQSYEGQPFPLIQFSERVYRMRLNDESTIPYRRFSKEVDCMARYKMVCHRYSVDIYGTPVEEWYFRHEKIMEFFIAQAFLYTNTRRVKRHFNDSQFYGVYQLLEAAGLAEETSESSQQEPDTDYPNVIKLVRAV